MHERGGSVSPWTGPRAIATVGQLCPGDETRGTRRAGPPLPQPRALQMELWITQLFNGISYGALLFLLAGGLSLIFGMMRIVNMTHGSYYLLGGYVALTVIWKTGYFALAILAGALAIALIGVCEWNAFLKRLSGQELGQVLTTMGFALIFQDLALIIWGGDPYTIP